MGPSVEPWKIWEALPRERQVSIICGVVCGRFGVGGSELRQAGHREAVHARRIAILLVHQLATIGSAALARCLGTNLSATLHVLRTMRDREKQDRRFSRELASLQEMIVVRLPSV
jgi:hypothetical protein